MPVGFRIEYNQGQFKKLSDKLNSFEREMVLSQTVEDVGEFMRYRLTEYPTYRFVSRVAAYGRPFFTDRQRRWFFAALAEGIIKPGTENRSGTLKDGWRIEESGPKQIDLVNEVPYAKFVQGTITEQARQPRMAGWRSITVWLREFKSEIGRVGMSNINKWVKS